MTDEAVIQQENTKPVPGKPFVKGDKRINRKGRPKSFDALRKLAIKIAGETIPGGANGEDITRIEAMLRVLTSSKAPADRALFLAYAYGKPKEQVDITTGGQAITFVVEREDEKDDNAPPQTA